MHHDLSKSKQLFLRKLDPIPTRRIISREFAQRKDKPEEYFFTDKQNLMRRKSTQVFSILVPEHFQS